MTNDELVAALEAKVQQLKADLDAAQKKALTDQQVARLQALLA